MDMYSDKKEMFCFVIYIELLIFFGLYIYLIIIGLKV